MKWHLVLCLFGLAAASSRGWKEGTEYVYQVRGRMLSGYPELGNQYTGIFVKGKLTIQARKDGLLLAQLSNSQHAEVHTQMPNGWRSQIPDAQLQYKPSSLSGKPFQIEIRNGVVQDIQVDKDIPNWEANIIRGVISQIQLDTKGENLKKSRTNQLPDEDLFYGVYKTMEETVTGKHETLYEVNQVPQYILKAEPWLVSHPQFATNEDKVYEVMKTRNYSNSEHNIGYHYGFGVNEDHWEPYNNNADNYFSRSSLSRVIISGKLQNYVIQSAVTTNEVHVLLNKYEEKRGLVVSQYNLTLASVGSPSSQLQEPSSAISLGSLVYRYDLPYRGDNKVRQGPRMQKHGSDENSSSPTGRSNENSKQQSSSSSEESSSLEHESNYWRQQLSDMSFEPQVPLNPYTVGYMGKSVKENTNIGDAVSKLAQQIGEEFHQPEVIPKEQTLAKFIQMTQLIQTMNEKEIEQIANELYNKGEQQQQGPQATAWKAFRDAVAESGTGPALLAIQKWIQSGKVKESSASSVIVQLAQSTRVPSENYMQKFYELCISPEVQNQDVVNNSALMAYSELVYKVYVNKKLSHNMYPVHVFGEFATSEGMSFVENKYIPYLKKQLDEAMQQSDKQKAQIYIRALGNTGHEKILSAYEPYLEGQLPATDFQRFQMVMALNKLVLSHPKLARSPLYKMYQNNGEIPAIRVAAVYQLMRTSPPADLLQRMAEYTNTDPNEQVNAAVKSSIQYGADVNNPTQNNFRQNAQAAAPLLTPKTYGLQYSRHYLRDYVYDQLNDGWLQSLQTVGSYNSYMPKYFQYSTYMFSENEKWRTMQLQVMVSNIQELVDSVLGKVQDEQSNQSTQESYARKLNVETSSSEDLDGSIFFNFGGYRKYFPLNKNAIQHYIEAARNAEETLRKGKSYQYSKFFSGRKAYLGFPSEMGLPVMYSTETPKAIDIDGQFSATAQPQFSTGSKIQKPHSFTANGQIRITYASKQQSQIGFFTPFSSKHYMAGYDNDIQVNLPLKGKIEVDIEKNQLNAQLEAIQPEKDALLVHGSASPYTSSHNILRPQPAYTGPNTHKIEDDSRARKRQTIGDESGMVYYAEYSERRGSPDIFQKFAREVYNDGASKALLLAPWLYEEIQSSNLNIVYAGSKSSNRQLNIRSYYKNKYESAQQQQGGSDNDSDNGNTMSQTSKNPTERLNEFYRKASAGIQNVQVTAVDASLEFAGQKNAEYTATFAYGRSPVDNKAKMLLHMERRTSNPYQISFSAKSNSPNTNGLDPEYAIDFDPTSTVQMHLNYGKDDQSAAKVDMHVKLQKSDERKQYMKSQPLYQRCNEEMKQGNKQLPACANITANANLMDRVSVQIQHQNLGAATLNQIRNMYYRYCTDSNYKVEESINSQEAKDSQINIDVKFSQDFDYANVNLHSEWRRANYRNIPIGEWLQPMVSVHPVFSMKDRYLRKIFHNEQYRPSCVVDRTGASTFDNKTYPIQMSNDWTIMMIYSPYHRHSQAHSRQVHSLQQRQEASAPRDESGSGNEEYMVLVRNYKDDNDKKEFKMVVRNSRIKQTEILLQPSSHQSNSGQKPKAIVNVNGKQLEFNDQRSTDIENGEIQIYALPNGEAKVDVRDEFYILYDGSRARLSFTHMRKYRNTVRGLCGPYSGEPAFNFRDAQNCQLTTPEEFVAAYRMESLQKRQSQSSDQQSCQAWEVIYGNYISDQDTRRHASCTKSQTQYEYKKDEICFTIQELPVCKSPCKPTSHISKKIAVHCLKRNAPNAQRWADQIDKGRSPNFGKNLQTQTMMMKVAQSCAP